MQGSLLVEISTEEIPASYINPVLNQFKKSMEREFDLKGVNYRPFSTGSTPRRLVLFSESVSLESEKKGEEKKGPPVNIAYDQDKNPTKVLNKFLESNGIGKSDIFIKKMDKGEYVFANITTYHGKTEKIISEQLPKIVRDLSFPKSMHWLQGKTLNFARPIRNLFVLMNNKKIGLIFSGIPQNAVSQKRFYMVDEPKDISNFEDFFSHLKDENIEIDPDKRKKKLLEGARLEASKAGGLLFEDPDLLDEVNNLTETPAPGIGRFDENFLKIPDVVLISVMVDHQRYFPILNDKGDLINKFIFVANQRITSSIVQGNEKVIRARFKDAEFFFEEDSKISIESLYPKLDGITFIKGAGTLLDKADRVEKLTSLLAPYFQLDEKLLNLSKRAAILAKTDQLTNLVFEFPELQGNIGSILALKQGEDERVAIALKEQYFPLNAGSGLPQSNIGALLSSCEKIDNLTILFAMGKIPTGSSDPFALRRQAIGLLEILIKFDIRIDLTRIIRMVLDELDHKGLLSYRRENSKDIFSEIQKFLKGRIKTILEGKDFTYDEIDALLGLKTINIVQGIRKLDSIKKIRAKKGFGQLLSAFKRVNNILNGARKKKEDITDPVNKDLFEKDEEKNLFNISEKIREKIEKLEADENFEEILNALMDMQSPIDKFFDTVMVMADDKTIRQNRLSLLTAIEKIFLDFIDFSKIKD